MKAYRNKYLVSNFVFLLCVSVLFLNDHHLKSCYPGWLTGKLSDVMGIIVLPLLLAFVFPRLRYHALWVSAVLFAFWKSPYSQSTIDLYNSYSFIGVSRVIDPTDLFVLVFLPIPYLVMSRIEEWAVLKIRRVNPLFVLLPTILILMATSLPPSYYYDENHTLKCFRCSLTVKYTQEEIVEKLRRAGIVFDSNDRSIPTENEDVNFYWLNRFIIDRDTLRNLKFSMQTSKNGKTTIQFWEMQAPQHIDTWKLAKKMKKYYERTVLKELKSGLQ